ncbi:hypothetical protein AB0G15_43365 [Streptosporangium sp. NPDC023825]|uniref:hypothetical protein n=1 Tax=Streptosporangium sp. NPDC023825 TaxID=3154909 RepID=UPI003423186A
MSTDPVAVPEELAEWLTARLEEIARQLRAARGVARQHPDNGERWVLGMLAATTDIEAEAKKIVHLLTAYGLRSKVTTAAPIARACGVTISSVTSRAGGRIASDTWNEVWPSQR